MAESPRDPAPMLSISNSVIAGGSFIQQDNRHFITHGGTKGFEYLKEAVAPAAFHNSGERFDPPRCYPKTRTAVMKKIMDWILGQDPETKNSLIMWLWGAAGAGKSAIAQSIAELCHEEHRLLASFFFGRLDPKRNNARYLVATIVYQIWSNIPSVRELIAGAIEDDPLVFTRSLITQIATLIVGPLQDLFQSGQFSGPDARRLILIDGIDECQGSQAQRIILDSILKAIHQLHVPLIFLIASRAEPDIAATLHSKEASGITTEISLDNLPNEDIELFLRDTFKEIRETHRFRKFIPTPWPTEDVLRKLVYKSSGQFIYAATIVKFVQSNRHRPDHRLDVVFSPRSARRDDPFAELDDLYTRILSSVEDIDRVLQILSFNIDYNIQFAELPRYDRFDVRGISVEAVEKILSFDSGETHLLFGDLGSVVAIQLEDVVGEEQLRMLHASLSDFLLDPSRSNQFHIDIASKPLIHVQKCIHFLSCAPLINNDKAAQFAMFFLYTVLDRCEPTAELYESVLSFSISHMYEDGSPETITTFHNFFLPFFFDSMRNLKLENAEYLYNHHLQSFDKILMGHLEIYYADMRLTLLIALVNSIRAKGISAWDFQKFQERFQIYDIDPALLDTDARCCSFLENSFPEYAMLISDFLEDPARAGQ